MKTLIGNKTVFLKSVDSTNSYLKSKLLNNKPEEGLLVFANEQYAGKGQRTNSWESQKGKNLLVSFIIYPNFLKADKQFILSKIISLSVFDFLSQFTDKVSIKWPNDIYIANKKIAGILIENNLKGNTISSSIIGLGININQTKFNSKIPNAISLRLITKKSYDNKKLLANLVEKLNYWYGHLVNNNISFINEQYLDKLFGYRKEHLFIVDRERIKASIIGISPHGKLIIKAKNGEIKSFAFKEIEFVFD